MILKGRVKKVFFFCLFACIKYIYFAGDECNQCNGHSSMIIFREPKLNKDFIAPKASAEGACI